MVVFIVVFCLLGEKVTVVGDEEIVRERLVLEKSRKKGRK